VQVGVPVRGAVEYRHIHGESGRLGAFDPGGNASIEGNRVCAEAGSALQSKVRPERKTATEG
jgi:hypothetical protein